MSLGVGNIIVQQKREVPTPPVPGGAQWTGIVGIAPELVQGTNTLQLALLIGQDVKYIIVDNIPENSLDATSVGGDGPNFTVDQVTGILTRTTPDVAPVDNPWIDGQKVIIP